MKLKNIIISALSALTLVSCSMDIEYKGKDGKRMLVMNSVVEAGQQTYISVSRSAFFLDVSRTGQVLTQSDDVTVSVDINGVELDASYVDSMPKELYDNLADGRTDFLVDHKRFADDMTKAVEQLERMLGI